MFWPWAPLREPHGGEDREGETQPRAHGASVSGEAESGLNDGGEEKPFCSPTWRPATPDPPSEGWPWAGVTSVTAPAWHGDPQPRDHHGFIPQEPPECIPRRQGWKCSSRGLKTLLALISPNSKGQKRF